MSTTAPYEHPDHFVDRHIGPSPADQAKMLALLGEPDLDSLLRKAVPNAIRIAQLTQQPPALSEAQVLAHLKELASQNQIYRSYIGMGYYGTYTPPVILRNVMENPGWYTQYTPYQAEIAQGRLEALLNFQTMVMDLTAMDIANASLLDESTAAAEAMTLFYNQSRGKNASNAFYVSEDVHPQTLAVLQTRAEPLGIELRIQPGGLVKLPGSFEGFGLLLQYPTTEGSVHDYRELVAAAHAKGAFVVVASDLLALTLLTPPGEWGADAVVGSAQRFGIPMGYGGPHPAFFACRDEFKRALPGRLVGVSVDPQGKPALRLALQTREQHIRREKATSNICTAQVLLAVMAGMYAAYHGPERLRQIALRTHFMARTLAKALQERGFHVGPTHYFDTIRVELADNAGQKEQELLRRLEEKRINLRLLGDYAYGISVDETTSLQDIADLVEIFSHIADHSGRFTDLGDLYRSIELSWPETLRRSSTYLTHPVFNSYHSETEMLRYLKRLENRDLSLAHSMIPLGSCTMKLNATAEMEAVTWPEFGQIHPFAPANQVKGYRQLIASLERWLCGITGFAAVSLQPNSGAQGEYTGLLTIRAYHRANGQGHRNIALIPSSAHGTNPASAVMAGMEVVVVKCDARGNIDLLDLQTKAEQYSDRLAALMVTYPSTHGVFEEAIRDVCQIVHDHGGLVYMDGANMNAQVGLTNPASIGADVCHLNLHKTFCIPHGGGGPGMGPIGVVEKLAPFLPKHPVVEGVGGSQGITPVAAAPYGSASILIISYAYIHLMGAAGLKQATAIAILNANYLKARLAEHYPPLYTNENGAVAHEFIIDLRPFKASAGIEVEDVAKRLIDYGFHAPTVSFPVPGTMMIEPTESESLAELDRFCEAMIAIRHEIQEIIDGRADKVDNVLKNAPHTCAEVTADEWKHSYSRLKAAWPVGWLRDSKFWPAVGRVNNSYGDRNLVCSCLPIEAYAEQPAELAVS